MLGGCFSHLNLDVIYLGEGAEHIRDSKGPIELAALMYHQQFSVAEVRGLSGNNNIPIIIWISSLSSTASGTETAIQLTRHT